MSVASQRQEQEEQAVPAATIPATVPARTHPSTATIANCSSLRSAFAFGAAYCETGVASRVNVGPRVDPVLGRDEWIVGDVSRLERV